MTVQRSIWGKSLSVIGVLATLAGCAAPPMGPMVQVLPGPGKTFDAFQYDQANCKAYASDQVRGQAEVANQRAVGAGVLTTVGVDGLTDRPAAARSAVHAEGSAWGYGRELFGAFRHVVTTAEEGATVCFAFPSGAQSHTDTPPDPNLVDRTVDA